MSKIDVVLCLDDNYVQHACVVMTSILQNTKNKSDFYFHILEQNVSDENKEKILSCVSQDKLVFHNLSGYDFSFLPLNRPNISIACYYRLVIADVLDDNIDKCIYLDCDVVVNEDLINLYNIDISQYFLGAVEDEGSIGNTKRLNLSSTYFNSGVLLMNLKMIRGVNFKKLCFDYYNKNFNRITLQDQDILNGVCQMKTLILPAKYNAQPNCFNRLFFGHNRMTQKDIGEAVKNPCVVHFSYRSKPWTVDCFHPLKRLYFKYLKQTPFKNFVFKIRIKQLLKYIFFIKNTDETKHIMLFYMHLKLFRSKNLIKILFETIDNR